MEKSISDSTTQSENLNNIKQQYNDIQAILLTKIKQSRQQFSEHHSKPIYVLAAVYNNAEGELFELCLQQESKDNMNERIILIPYHLKNSHWIGILIEFQVDGQIIRAEYIDPVNGIELIPDSLQEQFIKVYPNNKLQTRSLSKQDTQINSVDLTIENLLISANVQLPIMNTTDVSSEGNEYKLSELEQKLNIGLEKWEMKDIGMLSKIVQQTLEKIEVYKKAEKTNDAEKEMKKLNELKELKNLSQEIIIRKSIILSNLDTEIMTPTEQTKKCLYLDTLRKDLAEMPSCARKTIMKLLMQYDQKVLEDFVHSQQKDLVITLLQELKDQIKREELISKDIEIILRDLDTNIASNKCSPIVHCLNKLLQNIRPLNVPEIKRLVFKAEKAAELIRGKDVVLLVGATGTGKSTTIQFLAGCTMEKIQVEIAPGVFLDHITAIESTEDSQLSGVKSSPLGKSETRYIAPVTIKLSDVCGLHESGSIILCDAPGFNDTAGPEVNIANCIGVLEALKVTHSVKLLALLSSASVGDRGEGIQKLTQILIDMVKNIPEKLDAICYAFTKYSEKTNKNNITATLINIQNSRVGADPIQETDNIFRVVLSDMIEKANGDAFIIDPICGDPKGLIKKLNDMRGITDPAKVFQCAMSQETRSSIVNHTQKNKFNIICAIKHKNIKLVLYYLNDLKILKDLMKENNIRKVYDDSISYVGENITRDCTEITKNFNRALDSLDGLKEDDIRDYKATVEYFQQIQILNEHLGPDMISSTILMQNLVFELHKKRSILNEEVLHSPLIEIYLNNFRMLKISFKELETDYSSTCEEFGKRFEELVQSVHEPIRSNEFQQVAETILNISKSAHILQNHLHEQVDNKYIYIVKLLLRHLSSFSDKADSLLAKNTLNNDDIEVFKNSIEILISAKENFALQERISTYREILKKKGEVSEDDIKDLNEIWDKFIVKIIKYFNDIDIKIKEIFEKNQDHVLEDVQKLVENMNAIRTIPELELNTAEIYYRILENIRVDVKKIQTYTEQSLVATNQQSGTIDYISLANAWSSLKNATWINGVCPGTHDTLVGDLNKKLTEHTKHLIDQLSKLDLSIKCPNNVCIAQEIVKEIECISALEKDLEQLETYKRNIPEYFLQRVLKVLRSIEKNVTNEIREADELESMYANFPELTIGFRQQNYLSIMTSNQLIPKLKIEQTEELERVRNDKSQLNPQLINLKSVVETYDDVLGPMPTSVVTKFWSNLSRTPSRRKQQALYFLNTLGYESIEIVLKKILEIEKNLKVKEENEKKLDNYLKMLEIIKAKNQQPYRFNIGLDLFTTDNALLYVENCETINDDHVKDIATNTDGILKHYICKYGIFLEQKINENFKYIVDVETDSSQHFQDLIMGLNDLFSLSKYAKVFECIEGENKLKKCEEQFICHCRNLENKMQQCIHANNNRVLRSYFVTARIFRSIDSLFGIKFSNNGYGALYKKYYEEFVQRCKHAYITLLGYIEKDDYGNVDLELSHIDNNFLNDRELHQIQYDLQFSLNKLLNNSENIVNCLDEKIKEKIFNINEIEELKETINKIHFILQRPNIIKQLDDEIETRLDKFETNIKRILANVLLTSLNSIEICIDTKNFPEAEQCMKNLSQIHDKLTGYCIVEGVNKKAKALRDRLDNIDTEILQQNDFADIKKYSVNQPKDILAKIKAAFGIIHQERPDHHFDYGAKYNQVYKRILELLTENFTLAIKDARAAPLYQRAAEIHLLNCAVEFLPEELQNSFKLQIDKLNKFTADEEKAFRQDLDACFTNVDDDEHIIVKIGALANEYKKQKLRELFNSLREQCLKKLHIYRTNIQNHLRKQDIQFAVDNTEKILKYKKYVGTYIPEIEQICDSVHALIRKEFLHCCKTIGSISTVEQTQTIDKAFSDIIIYLDFSDRLDQNVSVLFPENVLQNAREEFQKMFEYFNANSKRFQVALKEINIIELHKIMIISKKWEKFLDKINQCRSRNHLMKNLLKEMENILLYTQMIFELENMINNLKIQLNSVELFNDDTTKFETKREELFHNIVGVINTLKAINSKFKDILPSMLDVNSLEQELKKKVQRMSDQLLDKASQKELSIRDSDDFRMYYNHLLSFNRHIQLPGIDIQQVLNSSEVIILNKVISLREEIIKNSENVDDVAEMLIKMKFLAENLSMFDRKINAEIDKTLKVYKDKQLMLGIKKLIVVLEKSDTGGRLISEHSCLTGESWRKRREKTQNQDNIEYVLKQLTGDDVSNNILGSCYRNFREKYDELISTSLKSYNPSVNKEPDVQVLVTEIKYHVGIVITTSRSITWNSTYMKEIPELLAYIFAVWTLKNTEHYNTMRDMEISEFYLLQPHVGQVIAIFRLLGIGYDPQITVGNNLINNLVEIGTGEGKSVVMAITACIFALIGIDVNCSCYSEVLSTRDKNDFASIFQALGVEERITYGTFNNLCEQFLNEQCNVREKVRDMIATNKSGLVAVNTTASICKKILLIDEVDVFLSDKFYGGMYNPLVILKDPPIRVLLDSIWQNKNTMKTSKDVKALQAYKTCATQYSNWMFLFDEAITDMLAALQSFQTLTHIVQDDKIGYVEGESIVQYAIYGYYTIWAYYHEHSNGNITIASLEANVGLIVKCGIFSYAEMPHDFAYIAGVTGTLKTLAQSEKDILKNVYSMRKNTFMPSVFEKNNRNYNSKNNVHVVNESEYFMKIHEEIVRMHKIDRAILVFFESEEKLMKFYNSPQLYSIKKDVPTIMETISVKDRELYIKRATTVGKVTLLTRIFGRGTDFMCNDTKMLDKGGVHVLQTFFSKELSEEYQIMGRGARQGDRGSYSMILLDQDLAWVLGSDWQEELSKNRSSHVYNILNKARNEHYESKCSTKNLSIEYRKREHKASKDCMATLTAGNITAVKQFLALQNKETNLITDRSRILLLIDGTYATSKFLEAVKDTVCKAFQRISFILEDKKLPKNTVQMQFAVYRDYDCKDELLQSSSWETKPSNLRSFLNKIVNKGGDYSTGAIEIGLWHAANESAMRNSISQVILIGNASANSKEQVKQKREQFGEVYWGKTKFSKPIYYTDELQKLKDKNIPIHTFYLQKNAADNFQQIASDTRGCYQHLDIHSSLSDEIFTKFLARIVFKQPVV